MSKEIEDLVRDAKEMPKPSPAPAIGYSMVLQLGNERQMTVQCFVSEDESDDTINRKIDKVFRAANRQKAIYDLSSLEEKFEETGRHLRNFLNALPLAKQDADRRKAVLAVELQGKRDARAEVYQEAYGQHVSSGRRGDFRPTGHTASRLAAMDAEIKKAEEAIAALPNDLEQHRQTTANNIWKYQDDLKKQRRRINDLRHLSGLAPYTEFEAEENMTVEEAERR